MTSDTAKPEAKPGAKPESFRSHLPAIVAATTGTVLAAVLGSLIGAAGTIVGMVIGSLASGTCSWWAERGIRRSAALATARAEAIRARGRPLHPTEEAALSQAVAGTPDATAAVGQHDRPRPRRRWAVPATFIAIAFVGCAIVVTLIEGAAGKPLSAMVQGKPGHGTTLGGGAVSQASPSPSPTPSGSPSPTSSGITTGTGTASPTPSGASSSPATSTAPANVSSSTGPAGSTPNSATPSTTSTGAAG